MLGVGIVPYCILNIRRSFLLFSEKIVIPKTKPNITFQGQGLTSTAIVWNDTANSSNGTFYSGSVQVFGANFIAKNISFMVRSLKKNSQHWFYPSIKITVIRSDNIQR